MWYQFKQEVTVKKNISLFECYKGYSRITPFITTTVMIPPNKGMSGIDNKENLYSPKDNNVHSNEWHKGTQKFQIKSNHKIINNE